MKIDEQAFLAALSYDPDTGIFTWKIDRPGRWKIKAGDRAGSSLVDNSGKTYRRICFNHVYVKEHRLAFLFMEGKLPDDNEEVDHPNGNGEDNRWCNLRKCSRQDNAKNLRKSSRNTSGVSGVAWDKVNKKWIVSIGKLSLGRFANFDDAVKARKEAEIEYNYHKNHGSVRPL